MSRGDFRLINPQTIGNSLTYVVNEEKVNPTISVVIPTFGYDPNESNSSECLEWEHRSSIAIASALNCRSDKDFEIVRSYGKNLANARNDGAKRANGKWLIFLDADDELDSGYISAMANASGDIRKPSTLGVVDGVEDDAPVMIPKKNLLMANHIVIGAMVRRSMFLLAGGFRDLPALEDWDLFLRLCVEMDAKIEEVHDAIYKVTVRSGGRNSDVKAHNLAYQEIRRRNIPIAKVRGLEYV